MAALNDSAATPPADLTRQPGRRLDLDQVVAGLRAARERWRDQQQRPREPGGRELPSREALAAIIEGLRGALFPMRLGPPELRQESEDYYVGHTLDSVLSALRAQVRLELRHGARSTGQPTLDADARALAIVHDFALSLPRIRGLLDSDVIAAFYGDPAAHSVDEVLLCYPGIRATISHRIAHQLYSQGLPLVARVVAELAHGETGIDIHPGAQIGPGFFMVRPARAHSCGCKSRRKLITANEAKRNCMRVTECGEEAWSEAASR